MLWLLSVNNDDKSDDDDEIECMLSTSHVECRHTHVLKWTFSSNVTKTDIFHTGKMSTQKRHFSFVQNKCQKRIIFFRCCSESECLSDWWSFSDCVH